MEDRGSGNRIKGIGLSDVFDFSSPLGVGGTSILDYSGCAVRVTCQHGVLLWYKLWDRAKIMDRVTL